MLTKTIFSTATGIALLWGSGMIVAPEATASVTSRIGSQFAVLIAPNCDTNPSACIRQKQENLTRLSHRLDRSRTSLEAEYRRAADVLQRNKALLGQNQLYLEQGRRMLRDTVGNGSLGFAGETYPTRESFRDQLELLFMEGERLQIVVVDAQSLHNALNSARRNLIARRSEIQATLSILPSKLALIEAQQSYAALEADMKAIDEVLHAGELGSAAIDRLLRSTSELAQAEARAPKGSLGFEAWLEDGQISNN